MHEPPQVPNYGRPASGNLIKPGYVLAIEPMVNAGGPDVHTEIGDDGRSHAGRWGCGGIT